MKNMLMPPYEQKSSKYAVLPPVIDTIRYTHWGPVTHTDEHKDMAMKWIGHQKATTNDIDYLRKINVAGDVKAYRDAVASFQYPAQNKIFASVQGDIAISVAGVMPIRPAGQGETLTSGESTAYDWQGFIPFDHAPYIINPTRGFVSSANQAPADPTYPYPLIGKRTFEDYRGRVVNMVLDSSRAMTPEDMKALQQNNYNLLAAELLPSLLSALDSAACLTGNQLDIAKKLSNWNYMYHRDSLSPVYFDLWYQEFENQTWDELDSLGVMRPEEWRLIEMVKAYPRHKYFDQLASTDVKESLHEIACASFSIMAKAFMDIPTEQRQNWGTYKHSTIPHLARFPMFGADYMHTSGGRHIVNAMSKMHGPSWRMIVEMSSPPKAWVNYPGGQSGNPASPHYRDMLDQFFEGKYYEVSIRNNPEAWTPARQINITPL
jgi:penicillin amidase